MAWQPFTHPTATCQSTGADQSHDALQIYTHYWCHIWSGGLKKHLLTVRFICSLFGRDGPACRSWCNHTIGIVRAEEKSTDTSLCKNWSSRVTNTVTSLCRARSLTSWPWDSANIGMIPYSHTSYFLHHESTLFDGEIGSKQCIHESVKDIVSVLNS